MQLSILGPQYNFFDALDQSMIEFLFVKLAPNLSVKYLRIKSPIIC